MTRKHCFSRGAFPCATVKLAALALALIVGPMRAQAELPVARLQTIFPPGGKAGSSFEVAINGQDLDDAIELLFSSEGLSAKPKMSPAKQPEPNKFIVSIGANVAPGVCDVRVRGRFGVSNPRAFAIGTRDEADEGSGNQSISSAKAVALDSTVNGRVPSSGADFFKVKARKGQRVLVECVAREIDSKMDPVLVLFDGDGKELDRSRRGGLLDFTAPRDGDYALKLHDFLYRGGDEYFYRLTFNTGPRVDFVFPPALVAGTKSRVTLFGRNLPGGEPAPGLAIEGRPLQKLEAEIEAPSAPDPRGSLPTAALLRPSDAVLDGFDYQWSSGEKMANPVFLSFATAPVVVEHEPNSKSSEAQAVSVPCEVAGQFFPANDVDWFLFEAKKGEFYWIELFSQRLGLPADPFALVQRVKKNDKGKEEASDLQELYDQDTNLGGGEFNTATRDPQWRFEVKEDGTYRVQVRDLFNRSQSNPALVYRLSIRKESPDFRLVALASAPPALERDKREANAWTPYLRRGGTLALRVLAFRRDNLGGEIQISVEDLPPGVTAAEAKIAAGQNAATLILSASDTAANWAGPLRIVGKTKAGETELVREARAGAVIWNVGDFNNEAVNSRVTRGLMLAVGGGDPSPFTLDAAEDKVWETSLGGKISIPLKLNRLGEFREGVKLRASSAEPPGILKEWDVDGKATSATLELDIAQAKIPAGLNRLHVYAHTKGKYRRVFPDELPPLEAAAKSADETAKQAEKAANEAGELSKKAAEALTAATKAVEEAEKSAKAAAEKLTAARAAAEKNTASESATTARAAAEREETEAKAKLKNAGEAKTTAAKAADEATAKAKAATKKKEDSASSAKAAAARIQAQDVNATFFSRPFTLNVAPAPITLAVETGSPELAQGMNLELPVTIQRLFGFNDAVEVTLALPKELSGVTAAKLSLAKDQTQGKLGITAAAAAKPGEHKLTLVAKLKFNNQELKAEQPVTLKIVEMKKE